MNTIIKRVWNQNRMVNIEALSGMAFQAEDGGHTFEISGINDAEEAVELSGTVAGVFMRPDGTDVALTGTASGGVASVTLSDACYAVAGRFGLTIFVTADSKKTCVYACIGTVAQTSYGTVAGDTPQDVVDLINAINAAIASIPADYTDLMAAIAPTYSDQSVYPAGAYRWYNGVLYKSKVAITTAESFTAAHWETVALADDVSYNRYAQNSMNEASYTPVNSSDYEAGRYNASSGTPASSAGTVVIDGTSYVVYSIRSKGYLPSDIFAITAYNTAYPVISAYDANDNYVGVWSANGFVTNVPVVKSSYRDFDLSSLRKSYPTYQFKLSVYDSSAISSAPDVEMLCGYIKYLHKIVSESELIDKTNRIVPIVERWENGKLSSSGQPSSTGNANQIRTNEFVKINSDSFTLTVGAGYVAQYYIYDSTKTFVSRSSNVREKTVIVPITKGYYIKLTAFNISQSAISPYEAKNIVLTYTENCIEAESDSNAVADYVSIAMFESIGVLGDSFASGVLYDPLTNNYVGTNYDLSWGQIMGREHGISVTNFSEGGLYTKTWLTDTDHGLTALLAADQMKLYIIAFGINDAKAITDGDMTLGTISDVDISDYTQNPDSFYGNYGRIIGNIQNHAPNSKIVCLSVAREGQRNMDEHINAIATKYKIPYVDLTNDLYFTSATFYGSFANGHPLAYGYSAMAKAITRLIERSIQQNQYYFSNYFGS